MKLGVVLCDGNTKWMPLYQSICNLCFKRDGDSELSYYHAWKGDDMPTVQNTKHLDALICLGSAHMVNDNTPWMKDLCNFFLSLENTPLKVLAICFSHHLINKAFGGKVEESNYGFIFGANVIKFENVKQLPVQIGNILGKYCSVGQLQLNLLESHRDEVSELPPRAVLLGSSKRCKNEVILIRDNILTMQSHPDLTPALMMEKIWPAITAKGFFSAEDRTIVEEEMRRVDTDICLEIIRDFLTA